MLDFLFAHIKQTHLGLFVIYCISLADSEFALATKMNYLFGLFCLQALAVLVCKGESILSVTNYGSLQISMVRHGEKYATNRDCYSYEDVPPRYHGMTHLRGLNDKLGTISLQVNVAVKVYLAVDSRYPYIHGPGYRNTGDIIMLGGCHTRTPFFIYESVAPQGPGLVQVNFQHSRMTGIFLRDSRAVKPEAELKVTVSRPSWEISMVREGEKFSTNRACYAMADVPPRFYGMTHIRGINDKPTQVQFTVNIPVKVYVAYDSRYPNPLNVNQFKNTGEKIVHAGCHPRVNFPIWERVVNRPGQVNLHFNAGRMMAIFVSPLYCDYTFKSGVYS